MTSEPLAPDAVSPAGIMQLGMAFWGSKTLLSAVELGVFTALATGPKTLPELQEGLGLHPRAARDFLDALVALRILDRQDGRYANTPEADRYLDRAKPSYVGGLLEMANRRLYGFWGNLTEALRTGQPQNESKDGSNPFTALYASPEQLQTFLGAMTGVSLPIAQAIAAAFPWGDVRSFVDVGCAQGGCTATIAAAHPHLSGTGFDLPAVQPVFEAYIAGRNLAGRVRFQPGNFFADPLPTADVIVMGHVLHDWDLPTKQALIGKAYAALPSGGTLLVYDAIIDDARRENAFGLLMSLNMLIETPGGFDYTGADCMGWMRAAGFSATRAQGLHGSHAMIIGTK
ncbi:acetylserotonin O-methyltransferase [Limobrevibacterium gyesilva]|uniref:Acetylserotonin O-methyltransferase n=1 Tax=Limobrevibacterium gyesilva TaxID=2991712 RepID=A0AA42CH28_9PROT|nr:acetylserotonin O-methyltransferase [Limobrevibacterium gyesilva]MCW3476776.1 acetylserotonin O-methyltransferase [Limobrevibacterium gyesilva]